MKIAVIGATGTIGSKIAAELEKRGHEVVPISRSHGVDVSSLADLSAALTGVDVVIDAINNMIMSSKKAQTAFISTSSNIAQAAADNDVKRIVCVSIAGVENPAVSRGYGYYAGKAAQEKTYQDSAVDTVIIRSTQWFELLDPIVQQVTVGPVSVLPTMKMAPIPAEAAAQLVCDVADGSEKVPRTGIVSIRGEEEGTTAEFVKRLLTARGEVGGKTPKVVRQLAGKPVEVSILREPVRSSYIRRPHHRVKRSYAYAPLCSRNAISLSSSSCSCSRSCEVNLALMARSTARTFSSA